MSFFKTLDTFSKCLDTIHISQKSFVHCTKITGSKWHNLTSKYYYFKIQLTHYIWIECLNISLQWSNYQLIQLLKMLRNCCITFEASFLCKMMNNIKCLDYESEATEDWLWSVSRCLLLWEKKNPQKSISLSSVFVFPTINVFLESDRAGSWWKPFVFLDEAGFNLAVTWRRGWEPSG